MNFFVATFSDDDSDDCQVVAKYDLGSFDATRLWNGERLGTQLPPDVILSVDGGSMAGYLPNPLRWPIVSRDFYEAIDDLVQDHTELIPCPVISMVSGRAVSDYFVLNPLVRIRAVPDVDLQDGWTIPKLQLDHARIPISLHIFRMDESPTVIIVSEELKERVFSRFSGFGVISIRRFRKH